MENKYELSKLEIATYLRDFYLMLLCGLNYQKVNFSKIFINVLENEGRSQYANKIYYSEMIKIYEFMLLSKMFTVYYDNKHNFLKEEKLKEINISENIFVNPNDRMRFSNKQIITYIRNAFNHNDGNDLELLKFIKTTNGENTDIKVEILLRDVNPVPFHVVLELKDLFTIMLGVTTASNFDIISTRATDQVNLTSNNANDELNKLYIRKFYSRRKISDENLEKIKKLIKINKKTDGFEEKLNLLGLEYKDYSLSIGQKTKIQEDLNYWEKVGVKGNDIIYHLINRVMPLSILKLPTIFMNICLTDSYIKTDKTLSEFHDDITNAYLHKRYDKKSILSSYIKNYGINKTFLYNGNDYENLFSITSSIYYGYLFDTLITEDQIKINDNKQIDRERIRNSFVHMRWYKGANECFKLFDWGNSLGDELNKDSNTFWSSNVKLTDMIECTERYYKEKLNNIDTKEPFFESDSQSTKEDLPEEKHHK